MKEYSDSTIHFVLTPIAPHCIEITFTGKSTPAGTDQLILWMEEEMQAAGEGNLQVLMDMRELTSIPLRVQLKMGAWLLRIKQKLFRVAIVGGNKTAVALAKGAKMTNVSFFHSLEEAHQWLLPEI